MLYLISIKKNTLFALDKILLQSCKNSIMLLNDKGDDPSAALILNNANETISYKVLGNKEDLTYSLGVRDSKFELIKKKERTSPQNE